MAGLLLPVVADAQGANAVAAPGSPTAERLPIYEVDHTWPPTLPNDWILGDIRGLFVDDNDHLWVIHMPSSLTDQEIGAARTMINKAFDNDLIGGDVLKTGFKYLKYGIGSYVNVCDVLGCIGCFFRI